MSTEEKTHIVLWAFNPQTGRTEAYRERNYPPFFHLVHLGQRAIDIAVHSHTRYANSHHCFISIENPSLRSEGADLDPSESAFQPRFP